MTRSGRRRLLVAILAVTGGLVVYALTPGSAPRPPDDGPQTVDVTMDMMGFDRSVIRVVAGRPVTIRLTNAGQAFYLEGVGRHQLAVDEFGVDIIAEPQATASATFTPTEPGTWEFYCDICCGGRANPSMVGTLIVEEA